MAADKDISWYPIPKGHGVCPACDGSGVGKALTENDLKYSWNKGKTHYSCMNCGGQDMSGKPRGYVRLDPATGKGCNHTFVGRNAGRCYTIYTCSKCNEHFDIDSGD